jgi:hypothetical protein
MHKEQTTRILRKLQGVRAKDKDLKVFGASSHKYELGKPATADQVAAFETAHRVTLPACYRAFLLDVANGGAGPFYGISTLDSSPVSLGGDLHAEPVIVPGLTADAWMELSSRLAGDEELSDAEYEAEDARLYAGILELGSQGCSCMHALVVRGEHAGRVVNIDTDFQKPRFCFELNFLDWYERWLDEIASGILLAEGPSWFGYSMGGSDAELLALFAASSDAEEKREALNGLARLIVASEQSCLQLLSICTGDQREFRDVAVQMLTKFSYPMAVPVLTALIDGDDADCLVACQGLHWYARTRAADWAGQLERRLPTADSAETFRFMTYLLKEAGHDCRDAIRPFCTHASEEIRVTAYYTLGLSKHKNELISQFEAGLSDPSPRVVHTTLQALAGVKDRALFAPYLAIIERFPTDDHYILTNLDHRLKELGFSGRPDFLARHDEEAGRSANITRIVGTRLKKILGR